MPIQTDLNVAPFFDDFDETKNFQRVLFRPRSVQARELNQAQAIIQNQIERLGRHLFQEGSAVIPGGINTNTEQDTVKVVINGYLNPALFETYKNKMVIRSLSRSIEAKVITYQPANGTQPGAFAIEYLKSDPAGGSNKFNPGEPAILSIRESSGDTDVASMTITSPHKGLFVAVLGGVYFVRGELVLVHDQTILADAFDNTSNVRVGFLIVEEIIDEMKDPSLYSNAIGTPNFKAPGAARLQMRLNLFSLKDGEKNSNFVEIIRFQGGELQKKIEASAYAVLDKAIAQRSYETNGNYVARDYPISVFQHLRDAGHPDGLYTAERGGNEAKFAVRLGSGVGYANGFRSEITGFEDIIVDKARDTAIANNASMIPAIGSYIVVSTTKSIPLLDIKQKLDLNAADGVTKVGSCRVRSIKRESDGVMRLYIFDIQMLTNKTFSVDAKKVKFTNANNLFTADISSSAIFESSADSAVFPLPYACAKSMTGSSGPDTTYSVIRTYDVTLDTNGTGSISLVAGESFAPVNNFDYAISLTGASNVGTNFVPSSSLVLGGTPLGRTITVNLGSANNAKTIRILTSVNKATSSPKVKTLKSNTVTLVFTAESKKVLPHADIYSIESAINQSNNLNELEIFSFFDGQRPNWYENGVLNVKGGRLINYTYVVTYTYFEHSTGDYFNVDSYGGMPRGNIPMTYETADRTPVSLADCLDFRPLKDSSGDFTLVTFNGDMVDPGDSVRFDLTYYLDRIDAVYLDQAGLYGAAKGIPADTPFPASAPAGAMKLFDLFVPAYTDDIKKISWNKTDNRRYTMRDIGSLETRIGNLEYYTSLNMLEAKVASSQILDPVTGSNRFKNGFSADGFNDFKLSDVNDKEWNASIDPSIMMLRSSYTESGLDLEYLSGANHAVGEIVSKAYTSKVLVDQPYATSTININPYAVFTWSGHVGLDPVSDFWKDIVVLPPVIINETVWLGTSARPQDVTVSTQVPIVPNFVIGPSLAPPPTRTVTTSTIWFAVNTQVSKTQSNWNTLISSNIIPYMRAIDVKFKLENFKPFTRVYPFFNGVPVTDFCNQTGKAKGQPIIIDFKGTAEGIFSVPNTTLNRFATGQGLLRFTDMPNDERTLDSETSGERVFASGGIKEVTQETRKTTTTMRQDWISRQVDPIAQTFFVSEENGCFLEKVHVFFATKAANAPVTMQIRRVQNGVPTSNIVENAQVIKYPADVVVSPTGALATEFKLKDPVYLEGNGEYAIVLLADTQEYNVWRAVMGENLTDRDVALSKQPYIGVLLSSSNARTWTPHQTEDLKFKVFRCAFDTTSNATVLMRGKAPEFKLSGFNPFNTESGSSTVTIRLRSHGLKTGDKVVITGAEGGNGVLAVDLNGERTISSSTIDTASFTVPAAATSTGTIGGSGTRFLANAPLTEFIAAINQVVYPGTSIGWEYSYLVQGSRANSGWLPFNNQQDLTQLDREGVVTKAGDLMIRATLKNTNDLLSPVFDTKGCGLDLIGRRIDTLTTGSAFAYVTRSVKFDNPSTSVRFWIGAYLPAGTTMKLYVKYMVTGDENLGAKDWIELSPTKPIKNSKEFQEYQFQNTGTDKFVGYKAKVVFLGTDPCNTPICSDFRSVALA